MPIPFIPAKHFIVAHREQVTQIVIHTTETGCSDKAATAVAMGFARGERVSSAHYVVGPSTVVRCVLDSDVAYHCKNVNRRGIGIEHTGRAFPNVEANRPATDWMTGEGMAVVRTSARLVAALCRRWGIPPRRLSDAQIVAGEKGILGHVDANRAYGVKAGHRDPGPAWPWETFLAEVAREIAEADQP